MATDMRRMDELMNRNWNCKVLKTSLTKTWERYITKAVALVLLPLRKESVNLQQMGQMKWRPAGRKLPKV